MKSILTSTLLVALIFCSSVFAAEWRIIETKQIKRDDILDLYPDITAISNGPIYYFKDQSNPYKLGRAYRVTTITQETADVVLLDEFNVGDEGFMSHLSSKLLNLRGTKCYFGVGKFRVTKWNSPTSFDFEMSGKNYRLRDIGSDRIMLIELK
jgi:hypothetical protein